MNDLLRYWIELKKIFEILPQKVPFLQVNAPANSSAVWIAKLEEL